MLDWQDIVGIIGRVLLGGAFLWTAYFDLSQRAMVLALITAKKIPYPKAAYWVGLVLKAVCGIALLVNIYTPFAALILGIFTAITTFIFHDFWRLQGEERQLKKIIFIIHIAVVGGLLAIVQL